MWNPLQRYRLKRLAHALRLRPPRFLAKRTTTEEFCHHLARLGFRPATVIDVGTNVTASGELVGDVDPAVAEVAGALSPVPGGVGPVTTALLIRHVVESAAGNG